ncbi:hypothetical protein BC830DRAFT_678468 [Chytriomyces sp. MP71]|nr:hypothetical protein BC830DRAFT_678468 [Chytriomyces sp. MP71]
MTCRPNRSSLRRRASFVPRDPAALPTYNHGLHMQYELINTPAFLASLLAIYIPGTLINLFVLITFALNHKTILKSRLDRITCALVAHSFVWSLGRTVIEVLLATNLASQADPVAACFTSMMMVGLFSFNLLLAMERWFSIRDLEGRTYYKIVYVVLALCDLALLGAFATSPSSDGVKPDSKFQESLWTVVASITFLGCTLGSACLYTATYRYATRLFDESPRTVVFFLVPRNKRNNVFARGGPVDVDRTQLDAGQLARVRLRAERQVLINCCLMGAGVLVAYSPFFLFELVRFVGGVTELVDGFRGEREFWWVACFFVAVDSWVTPGLVLYYRRDVRRCLVKCGV